MLKFSARWVRVMADYCTDGLWSYDGSEMFRELLPVSPALLERHRRWCEWWERNADYVGDPPAFDYAAFSAEGRKIARAIKTELPDWTVIYFDEEECLAIQHSEAAPREIYEYEIV